MLNYGVSNKKEKATFHYYPEMAGMSGRFADKETILSAVSHYMEYDKKSLQDDTNLRSKEQQEIASSFYENVNDSAEFNTYLSSLYESEEVECQLTTVSDIIDELDIKTIDLLKLDVEKSECLVLDGIRSEHWSMIRHLAVEVDGDHNLDIIHTLLKEKGYSITAEELVMSDASAPQEENTYMLYATNTNHGVVPNDSESIIKLQTTVNENTISEALNNKLPAYMVPKEIIFVPTITLMGNGKVDLEKLKNNKPKKQEETKPVKLTNKTELEVYNLWCEVLKKEYIPHHISIFEAGGNSIEVVLLHEKLQNAFKVEFSLVELFRNPTIAQQAKLIQESGSQKESTAKQALDKGKSRRQARARTKRVK